MCTVDFKSKSFKRAGRKHCYSSRNRQNFVPCAPGSFHEHEKPIPILSSLHVSFQDLQLLSSAHSLLVMKFNSSLFKDGKNDEELTLHSPKL